MSEVPLYSSVQVGRARKEAHPPRTLEKAYRGTSLTRACTPLGPYRRPMPKVFWGSLGGGRFLMGKVPLYAATHSSFECCNLFQYSVTPPPYRGTSLIRNSPPPRTTTGP